MLGEYADIKRQAYGKKITGSTAYAVALLPVWFVVNLFGLVSVLSADVVSTSDAVKALLGTLLPLAAFLSLFLADVTTVIINMAFLAFNSVSPVASIIAVLSPRGPEMDAGLLGDIFAGVFATLGAVSVMIDVGLLVLYALCAVMFLRHIKYFTHKI